MSNYNNNEGGGRSGGHFGGKPAFGGGGKRFGGKPSFGAKKSWGGDRGGSDRPTTMHQATCSVCGKPCEVPFKPMSGKPIYCKDHFISKVGDKGGDRGGDRRDDRGGDRFPKRDFSSHSHASAGASAPAFGGSRPAFEKPANNEQMTKQLEAINTKLERLIQVVETLVTSGKKQVVEVSKEEVAATKKTAKKKVAKK